MHIFGRSTHTQTHRHKHTHTLIDDHDDVSGDDDVGQVSLGEYVVAAKKGRPCQERLPPRPTDPASLDQSNH